MYKEDLALNNLQWLICHKTKPNILEYFDNLFVAFKVEVIVLHRLKPLF